MLSTLRIRSYQDLTLSVIPKYIYTLLFLLFIIKLVSVDVGKDLRRPTFYKDLEVQRETVTRPNCVTSWMTLFS